MYENKLLCELRVSPQSTFLSPLSNPVKMRFGNRKPDRPSTIALLIGGSVIIRCIYKSGTTLPARLPSINSHCIIVLCQICQLTLASLIKWTTQSRWTARKQPVIFPVIIPLFGSLRLAASFPHDLLSPQKNLWNAPAGREGAKQSEKEHAQGQKLLNDPSVVFNISGGSYYWLQRERERGNALSKQENQQKQQQNQKSTLSFLFSPSYSPLYFPSSPELGARLPRILL